MSNPHRTEEDITTGLMALIAWAGNAGSASRALKSQGKLNVTPGTLTTWAREKHASRYQELRDKYAAQLEAQTIAEMRELTQYALMAERLAIEKTMKRLDDDEEKDPARAAANMASVAQKNTDKQLSLQGRPTQITETRNLGEILRSLQGKGILQMPDGDAKELAGPRGQE